MNEQLFSMKRYFMKNGSTRPFIVARSVKKPSPVAAVDLEEHCSEYEEDPDDSGGADGVRVDEAGEDDGHGLPQGHDDDEDDGAKLRDGVVDEELAHGGAHRQDHAVKGEDGVLE